MWVVIKAGDVVPADMVILEAIDLKTNEAVLTGESSEVMKSVDLQDPKAPFKSNMLYSSTEVLSGFGKAEVTWYWYVHPGWLDCKTIGPE